MPIHSQQRSRRWPRSLKAPHYTGKVDILVKKDTPGRVLVGGGTLYDGMCNPGLAMPLRVRTDK
jgi:hypothetical protein